MYSYREDIAVVAAGLIYQCLELVIRPAMRPRSTYRVDLLLLPAIGLRRGA